MASPRLGFLHSEPTLAPNSSAKRLETLKSQQGTAPGTDPCGSDLKLGLQTQRIVCNPARGCLCGGEDDSVPSPAVASPVPRCAGEGAAVLTGACVYPGSFQRGKSKAWPGSHTPIRENYRGAICLCPAVPPHVLFTLGRGRFLSARPQGLGWGKHSLTSVPSLLSVSRALESEKDYKKIKSGLSLQPTRLLQVFQLPAQTPLSPLSPHDKGTEWAEAVASVQRGCGKKRTINRAGRTGNHL